MTAAVIRRRVLVVVRDWAYAILQWVRSMLTREPAGLLAEVEDACGLPVLLLPGILETWRFQLPLARALVRQGHSVLVVPGLGLNLRSLEASADIVARQMKEWGERDLVVVAHSKGGLIAKQLLLDPRTQARIRGVVAVGTPFGGSPLSVRVFARSPLGMFSPTGPVITRLTGERGVNARIVSLAAAWDEMVPTGSRLEGGTNVPLELEGHFLPLTSPLVHEIVHHWVHAIVDTRDL